MSYIHRQTCVGFLQDDDERLRNRDCSCIHLDPNLHCMFFIGKPRCDDLVDVKPVPLQQKPKE